MRIQRDGDLPQGVRGRWSPRLVVWPAYDGLDPIAFSLARPYDLEESVEDEWGRILAGAVERFCGAATVSVYTFRPAARRWLNRRLRWDLALSPDYYALTAEAINVRARTAHDEVVHLLAGPLEPAVVDLLRGQPVLDAPVLLEHGPVAVALAREAPRAVLAFRREADEQRFVSALAEAAYALGYRIA